MKVVESTFEHRIRQQTEIDDKQFGFMKGKGTTDAIFMARQMQGNFRVKSKKLYFGFVDLQKAFDRMPREVISWAMRKLGVEEWLVSAVMSMYTGAKTVVRAVFGNSRGLEAKVGTDDTVKNIVQHRIRRLGALCIIQRRTWQCLCIPVATHVSTT